MADWNKGLDSGRDHAELESVEEAPTVVELPAAEADPAPEPEAEKSLLKKEISFRRTPKELKQSKAAKLPKQPKQPKAEGSGLKKEISFSFKRQPKAAQPAEAKPKQER